MRNAEAGRLISRGSLGVVTGERPEIERLTGSFGGGPLEKGRKVPRWRPTLLHEQFLGGWAGAIPPGYPAHAMPFGPTVPTLPHLSLCEYSHHLNKHCILILSGFTTETPKGVHCLK